MSASNLILVGLLVCLYVVVMMIICHFMGFNRNK